MPTDNPTTARQQMEADGSAQPMTWEAWLSELNQIAGDAYGPPPMTNNTGEECWRDWYDDGYSPADAWAEDRSCDW